MEHGIELTWVDIIIVVVGYIAVVVDAVLTPADAICCEAPGAAYTCTTPRWAKESGVYIVYGQTTRFSTHSPYVCLSYRSHFGSRSQKATLHHLPPAYQVVGASLWIDAATDEEASWEVWSDEGT